MATLSLHPVVRTDRDAGILYLVASGLRGCTPKLRACRGTRPNRRLQGSPRLQPAGAPGANAPHTCCITRPRGRFCRCSAGFLVRHRLTRSAAAWLPG
jgi:hypothetical protein